MIYKEPLQIIDLTTNPDPTYVDLLAQLEMSEIVNSQDKRAKNYQQISTLFKDYFSFHLLVNTSKNEIVAFSAIQSFGKYARICTRTYYSLKYRSKVLARTNLWAEKYLIPYEVEKCKAHGFDGAFISMEPLTRRASLQDLIARLNELHQSQWTLLPELHNTCRLIKDTTVNNHISCWQNIALLSFKSEGSLDLPHLSISGYKNL